MAYRPFVADSTIPGLGASDLVRRAAVHLGDNVTGFGANLRAEIFAAREELRLRRDLRNLGAEALTDIGLDRDHL
ncbi:hypothetical protein [Algihabitans albus]|uniref:hypothetical protein n=1 Tax=Algihabitans albus TaxID=2164067 RepID=UPI000E5CF2E9|nr:hypothetical protein [Algihabitans albus]